MRIVVKEAKEWEAEKTKERKKNIIYYEDKKSTNRYCVVLV